MLSLVYSKKYINSKRTNQVKHKRKNTQTYSVRKLLEKTLLQAFPPFLYPVKYFRISVTLLAHCQWDTGPQICFRFFRFSMLPTVFFFFFFKTVMKNCYGFMLERRQCNFVTDLKDLKLCCSLLLRIKIILSCLKDILFLECNINKKYQYSVEKS